MPLHALKMLTSEARLSQQFASVLRQRWNSSLSASGSCRWSHSRHLRVLLASDSVASDAVAQEYHLRGQIVPAMEVQFVFVGQLQVVAQHACWFVTL